MYQSNLTSAFQCDLLWCWWNHCLLYDERIPFKYHSLFHIGTYNRLYVFLRLETVKYRTGFIVESYQCLVILPSKCSILNTWLIYCQWHCVLLLVILPCIAEFVSISALAMRDFCVYWISGMIWDQMISYEAIFTPLRIYLICCGCIKFSTIVVCIEVPFFAHKFERRNNASFLITPTFALIYR